LPSGTVLSIQNVACETLGILKDMLESDGFKISNIHAWSDTIPNDPSRYSAIIILGGPMSVHDGYNWLVKEQALIRGAIKEDIPVLGICLGSQLVAQALGGRVYKGSKKEIGWFNDVSLTEAGLRDIFAGLTAKKIKVFQWHGDTYSLPKGAELLASSELYPQAFRIGSAVGLQFHLEVTKDLIKEWTRQYSDEMVSERIKPEDIKLDDKQLDELAATCRTVYSNFIRSCGPHT